MGKTALITGVTGQDGAYLARLLLGKGYAVHGFVARRATESNWRLREMGIEHDVTLVHGDLTDMSSLCRAVESAHPDEVYNLAAQSFVGTSWAQPQVTAQVNGVGVVNMLEALRRLSPGVRFYQASTSEMFGLVQTDAQDEKTPFHPRSPYGVAKLFGHWSTINYRESYGMHASNGILFNHESPLRGIEFVTRKVTRRHGAHQAGQAEGVAPGQHRRQARLGICRRLCRGDVADAAAGQAGRLCHRHRGHDHGARNVPHCVPVTSGSTTTTTSSSTPSSSARRKSTLLLGNPAKAKRVLGWQARTGIDALIAMMVDADMRRVSRE